MLRIIKLFVSLLFFMMFVKTNAQERFSDKELSVNIGLNGTLDISDFNTLEYLPRVSMQYKQLEIGGFYCISEDRFKQKNDYHIELPDLYSEETKLNLFVKYYPIKNIGFNIEFGYDRQFSVVDLYNNISRFEKNIITGVMDKTNTKQLFDLSRKENAFYLGLGYSIRIIKGLFISSQLSFNTGKGSEDIYVDELLTHDASEFNREDVDKHRFYTETLLYNFTKYNFRFGLTYKLGIK